MKTASWWVLALVAPLALVGCESESAPAEQGGEATAAVEPASDDIETMGEGLTGPNTWVHQPLQLDCSTGVSNKVARNAARHFYSFAGQPGQSTTFQLSGNWPSSLGARIYVVDDKGNVVSTAKNLKGNSVSTEVVFKSAGKHFVHVSPYKFQLVQKSYGYKLSASCQGGGCVVDSDCGSGEACVQVVCKGLNCKPTSYCQAQPLCATASILWEGSTTPTYYAQNVADQSGAQAFYESFPAGASFQAYQGACDQGWACPALYKPVCGVIKSDAPKTFSNACAFAAAVRADAGSTDGQSSKGFVQSDGECGPVCDYNDPARHYVAQSPEQCKLVKFACQQPGQTPFFDDCGCGCADPQLARLPGGGAAVGGGTGGWLGRSPRRGRG